MTELKQVYKCEVCGNMVEVVHNAGGTLKCCGQAMNLIVENIVDAAKEKHGKLERQVAEVQGQYDRAKTLDERRLSVMKIISAALSKFVRPELHSKLSGNGLSIINDAQANLESLSKFDNVPLVTRPE